MGAFFDGTLTGLRRFLTDGRDNLREQLPNLNASHGEYREDVRQLVALYDRLLAVLPRAEHSPPASGPATEAHPKSPSADRAATPPRRQGSRSR